MSIITFAFFSTSTNKANLSQRRPSSLFSPLLASHYLSNVSTLLSISSISISSSISSSIPRRKHGL